MIWKQSGPPQGREGGRAVGGKGATSGGNSVWGRRTPGPVRGGSEED